jgi:hypothetical protein
MARKRRVRSAFARTVMAVPFIRRAYARRVLKMLENAEKDRKPLPPELQQVQVALKRLPNRQRRLELLEASLRAGPNAEPPNRATRRAMPKPPPASARPGAKGRRKKR